MVVRITSLVKKPSKLPRFVGKTEMAKTKEKEVNFASQDSLHVGASKANPQEGVKVVEGLGVKKGSPEWQRRQNNKSRDMRTNLGKSRPMTPVAE